MSVVKKDTFGMYLWLTQHLDYFCMVQCIKMTFTSVKLGNKTLIKTINCAILWSCKIYYSGMFPPFCICKSCKYIIDTRLPGNVIKSSNMKGQPDMINLSMFAFDLFKYSNSYEVSYFFMIFLLYWLSLFFCGLHHVN